MAQDVAQITPGVPDTRSVIDLQRLLGLATFILIVLTSRLWFPFAGSFDVTIPWFSVLTEIPAWVDFLCLGLLSAACVLLTIGAHQEKIRKICCFTFTITLTLLLLLDQHRLQPWVLQFWFLSLIFLLAPNATGLRCCRAVVIAIYLYSALSKVDVAFFESHGQLLLDGLLQSVRIDASFWSMQTRKLLIGAFPAGEFLVALLLVSPRTRCFGLYGSWLMHAALLLTLGPLGLNHETGVLAWNVFFVLQNSILFRGGHAPTEYAPLTSGLDRAANALTTLFVLLPLLENAGWYDHWPAWAVYSSRPEKVDVLITESAAETLPPALQNHLAPPLPLQEFVPFSLDHWSFATYSCPVYPQDRYRVSLANALLRGSVPTTDVQIVIASTPNRRTGERTTITLNGWTEIDAYRQQHFFINTSPRR